MNKKVIKYICGGALAIIGIFSIFAVGKAVGKNKSYQTEDVIVLSVCGDGSLTVWLKQRKEEWYIDDDICFFYVEDGKYVGVYEGMTATLTIKEMKHSYI